MSHHVDFMLRKKLIINKDVNVREIVFVTTIKIVKVLVICEVIRTNHSICC